MEITEIHGFFVNRVTETPAREASNGNRSNTRWRAKWDAQEQGPDAPPNPGFGDSPEVQAKVEEHLLSD
jgi:hypothetical protein